MKATIDPNEVTVRHNIREDIQREFLTVDCPEGWDDVKKLVKKVLTFEGRKFAYTGWNSDRNEAFFARPLNGVEMVARIS